MNNRRTSPDLGDYRDWLIAQGMSVTTIAERLGFAERLLREWGRLDVAPAEAAAWLNGYAGWTRSTYLNHLRSLYRWAIETGRLEASPLARYRKPPEPRPKPKPLSAYELNRALEAADRRTRTWLLLGFLAGLRAHEIAQVHGRDLDETTFFVRGKGGDESLLPTHEALWALAQSYPRDDWWFPSTHHARDHVHPSLVSNTIRDLFRSVGITHGATHRLRYSYASRLAAAGTPIRVVQELLRHRSLETTMRYVAVDDEQKRAALRQLGGQELAAA